MWTPTILLLDSEGRERVRLEGYLPNADFNSALRNGLARLAFLRKKYVDAERWYADVIDRFAGTHFAPEAMYWRTVALYQATHDHSVLSEGANTLRTTYPSSVWASKAIPWLP